MKRVLFAGLFLGVMLFAVHALMAGAVMDVKSSLAGTVTWTAEPGSTLTAGAEIVRVRTLTGEAAPSGKSLRVWRNRNDIRSLPVCTFRQSVRVDILA